MHDRLDASSQFLSKFIFVHSYKNCCVNICSHKKSSQNICPSVHGWACCAISSSKLHLAYVVQNWQQHNSWSKLNMHISSLNSSGASKKGGSVVSQLRRRRSHIFCNKSFAPIFPHPALAHQKLFSPRQASKTVKFAVLRPSQSQSLSWNSPFANSVQTAFGSALLQRSLFPSSFFPSCCCSLREVL